MQGEEEALDLSPRGREAWVAVEAVLVLMEPPTLGGVAALIAQVLEDRVVQE